MVRTISRGLCSTIECSTSLLMMMLTPRVRAKQLNASQWSALNYRTGIVWFAHCIRVPDSPCQSPSLIQSNTHSPHLSLHHSILFLLHFYHHCRHRCSLSPAGCLRALPRLPVPTRPRWVKGATAHNEFNYSSACFYGGGTLGTLPSTSLYWSEASKGRKGSARGGWTQMDRWEGINLVGEENNCVTLKW